MLPDYVPIVIAEKLPYAANEALNHVNPSCRRDVGFPRLA